MCVCARACVCYNNVCLCVSERARVCGWHFLSMSGAAFVVVVVVCLFSVMLLLFLLLYNTLTLVVIATSIIIFGNGAVATTLIVFIAPFCFTSTEERRLIRDGDRGEGVIVQELCESRGGRPGLSVLTSLLVSVDVKNY